MKLKKLLSVAVATLAAVSMIATSAITSYAAGEGSITINNTTEGHTYEAYQVFKGTLSTGGVLSDIDWGKNVDTAAADFNADIKAAVGITAETFTAEDVAGALTEANVKAFSKAIGKYLTGTAAASTFADGKYTIDVDEVGYYLVKDKDGSLDGKNEAYTGYILQVLGTKTNIDPKTNTVPTPGKVIVSGDAEVAAEDYSIGDTVTFKITATLPDDYDEYDSYKLIFNDTLSAGLTYAATTGVTVDGNDAAALTPAASGTTITYTIEDVKTAYPTATAGSVIAITYTATLNENAVIGSEGNLNTVNLEFSNNPNSDSLGKTNDVDVKAYSYQLNIEKVDGADNTTKLKGAEFVLKNADGTKYAKVTDGKFAGWVDTIDEATVLTTGDENDDSVAYAAIVIKGLASGTYKLEETKAPANYNKLTEDVTIVIADAEAQATATVQTVENKAGSTLPTTGGIGTTIFFVCGGLIVAATAVLLIVKRRANTVA